MSSAPPPLTTRKQRLERFWHGPGALGVMWLLVAVTLASPLADLHPVAAVTIALLVLLLVLGGASMVGNRKIVLRLGIPFAVLWLLSRLLSAFGHGDHFYNHMSHVVGLGLSSAVLWAIFDRLQNVRDLTRSVLAEAFIGYLIIAIAFSQIYWIVGDLDPNAFQPAVPLASGATYLYFSMCILTSLGYSATIPINPYLRLVTAFESMAGIFFVAIVVARLISSRRS